MSPQRHHVYENNFGCWEGCGTFKVHVHTQGKMRDPLGQQDSAEGAEMMGFASQSRSDRQTQNHNRDLSYCMLKA